MLAGAGWLAGWQPRMFSFSLFLLFSRSLSLSLSLCTLTIPQVSPIFVLSRLFLSFSFVAQPFPSYAFTSDYLVLPFVSTLFHSIYSRAFLKMTRHFLHLNPCRFVSFSPLDCLAYPPFTPRTGVSLSPFLPMLRCSVFQTPPFWTGGSPPPASLQWSRCRGRRPGVCFRRSKLLIEKAASSRGTKISITQFPILIVNYICDIQTKTYYNLTRRIHYVLKFRILKEIIFFYSYQLWFSYLIISALKKYYDNGFFHNNVLDAQW